MAIIRKATNINAGEGVEETEAASSAGGECKLAHPMENSMGFLKNLKAERPYDPARPPLGTPLKKTTHTHSSVHCSTIYNSPDAEAT